MISFKSLKLGPGIFFCLASPPWKLLRFLCVVPLPRKSHSNYLKFDFNTTVWLDRIAHMNHMCEPSDCSYILIFSGGDHFSGISPSQMQLQIVPVAPSQSWRAFFQHPLCPVPAGWVDDPDQYIARDQEEQQGGRVSHPSRRWCMNRNARRGNRANKGSRPCSRIRRRKKRRAYGNHRR